VTADSLFGRFWQRLGLVTSRDAHAAAERLSRRLERAEKRASQVTETLDQREQQTAATAGALDELTASIRKLQQSVDAVGHQLQLLAIARKQDLQAVELLPRVTAGLEALADTIDAHLGRVMADATVSSDPFPHLVIEKLLPPGLYDSMLDALPPREFWRSSGRGREYWEVETDVAPWRTEAVWRFVDRRIVDQMLRPRLEQAFAGPLAAFWRDNFALDPGGVRYHVAEGRLQLRGRGYRLRAHLDPPHAALTGLFYLARPGDDIQYGTALYRPSAPIPARRQGIYYPEDHGIALENVTTVPFRANSLLVWMTSLGPHGADLTADDVPKSFERYTYQFQLVTDHQTRRRIKEGEGR
jgi:hypothetical protein